MTKVEMTKLLKSAAKFNLNFNIRGRLTAGNESDATVPRHPSSIRRNDVSTYQQYLPPAARGVADRWRGFDSISLAAKR